MKKFTDYILESSIITDQKRIEPIYPDNRIKIFISSSCGNEKYDGARARLKAAIESTKIADVYTFEGRGASTLSAEEHYTCSLKDSDICIFLIDNADGIVEGVQAEIDTVQKYNIKALYYFCDEQTTEKTSLEKSLVGKSFAKCSTVHKFEDLVVNGAKDVINDIVFIYHIYCKGQLVANSEDDESHSIDIFDVAKYQLADVSKTTIKDIDKCKDYILKQVLGHTNYFCEDKKTTNNEFDDWGVRFLSVLFEGRSIRDFNVMMYLEFLKQYNTDGYHQVVSKRWEAIQACFSDDVEKCVGYLDEALSIAKEKDQPQWVIKDILIDLRNQHIVLSHIKHTSFSSSAQEELDESTELLYYPVLDRIYASLQERYIEELYKKKIASPYTVTIGNNLDKYGEWLASALIISMCNASLTQILLTYQKIRDFTFYLCCKYEDWELRRNLYKFTIFTGDAQQIKGVEESYPDVLNKMTANDAEEIMVFCRNQPIAYKMLNTKLLAFGAVGYYLSNESYKLYEKEIVDSIKEWLTDENTNIFVGQAVFKCLSGVAYRISQDILSDICCRFIDRHYLKWYTEVFRLSAQYIDINKMSEKSAENLIEHFCIVLDDEEAREYVTSSPMFLCKMRKQNKTLTENLNKKVADFLPEYYEGVYKLETTENKKEDIPKFIQEYIEKINMRHHQYV